ncbi:ATP-binding protein, partial [Burkholderia ambifaria]|uniref:ATP-binding protein n=1 Tax=Burkholderia ambifaria TaxID=152480 RepID=UPI001FC8C721
RPSRRVTRAVESRRPEALDPLPDNRLPQEVQPLVHALNGLLARSEPDGATVREPVALADVLAHCVSAQAVVAQKRNIDLGIEEAQPAIIDADIGALRVMLNNVLDNAVKYTPEGGRIDVSLSFDEGRALVRVADSGPGIPP